MFRTQTSIRTQGRAVVRIPVESIRVSPSQPRRQFAPETVEELASSIRRHGLLSPLLVRKTEDGGYELIAGERRLRALISLERRFAEAIVLNAGDCECALIALIENIQREQLHFLDEAEACRRILRDYPITQDRLAASLSCSPSALANRLRILKLPEEVLNVVREKGLTERHARALLRLDDPRVQLSLAGVAAEKRMSVKQLESRVEQHMRRLKGVPVRRVSPVIRDNRIVINALMETVRELGRIGVQVKSRVEEKTDHVELIVSIPFPMGCREETENEKTEENPAEQ
ncbi:MAG: ParB/RepB/Spo0J family partition protein [Clostridia bacterium]|nr:ParB/RepB/Spo0J family partition protein [Clostridia bacterium]